MENRKETKAEGKKGYIERSKSKEIRGALWVDCLLMYLWSFWSLTGPYTLCSFPILLLV